MSNKTNLKNLFAALQQAMLSEAEFSPFLDHPDDKGNNSEENWRNWFTRYLPQRYKVAKATIIDSRDNISDQIDAVLYDAQYSYLAWNEKGILYIPAESVYAVFEVKQNLDKENMIYAGQKVESVRKLYRTSAPIPYAGGTYKPKTPPRIIGGILTTRSDWSNPFAEPFKNCIDSFLENQQIDCGCVLDAGAFYYNYKDSKLRTSKKEESLVYFFLQLLILLQNLGTVPAIDLNEYMKALSIKEEQ